MNFDSPPEWTSRPASVFALRLKPLSKSVMQVRHFQRQRRRERSPPRRRRLPEIEFFTTSSRESNQEAIREFQADLRKAEHAGRSVGFHYHFGGRNQERQRCPH